jgi:hypothetical protein
MDILVFWSLFQFMVLEQNFLIWNRLLLEPNLTVDLIDVSVRPELIYYHLIKNLIIFHAFLLVLGILIKPQLKHF